MSRLSRVVIRHQIVTFSVLTYALTLAAVAFGTFLTFAPLVAGGVAGIGWDGWGKGVAA
jgi:hypothetical protein